MIDNIKRYVEIIVLAGSMASGLWFGVVKPTIQRIVKNEIGFQAYLLMEIATDQQIENATRKWKTWKAGNE